MSTLNSKVQDFLAQERIAVAGVSRTEENTANGIFRKLRDSGYQVFPVNPNAERVEGVTCYPDLKSIPGGVDGVVIVTRPDITQQVVRDAAQAGVGRVWMHDNTFMMGSVSDEAVKFCEENGITVIAGACPMMYLEFGHKCFRYVLGMMGRLPN